MVPPDNHVHTEWSWDAAAGSMEASCARALELGLPSIAFAIPLVTRLTGSQRTAAP